jgi:outer membrane protein assembly factor BamB
VDTSTGTEKWNRELDNVAISAPAVVSNTVYVGVWEALYAINSDTGEVNWIYRLENGSDDTYYGDPVVYAGTVYFGGRKYFYALDSKTGREKWKVNLSATPSSVPTVYDGIIYVGTFTPGGTHTPYLYALDGETGQEKWKVKITGQGISGAVAATDRVVYAETWDDGLLALNASSGQEIWRYNTGTHLTGAPTVGYSTVYATNQGTLYALDSQTGKEKWKLQVGGGLYTDSVIADGIIYFGSSEINLGTVFSGHGNGNLHAVDTNSRQELWKFSVDATISRAPAVENGIVYFGGDDGTIYAVK